MFEKDIKFIYDLHLDKIKKLGPFFTIRDVEKAALHPAITHYLNSEIDFMIFRDRQVLLRNSVFDYSGETVRQYYDLIGEELKNNKKFSLKYFAGLLMKATIFNVNFLARPRKTLVKLLFETQDTRNSAEIKQILGRLYYYTYLKRVTSSFIDNKKIISLRRDEFRDLLKRIDELSLESNRDNIINTALASMSEFFRLSTPRAESVPLPAVRLFLEEKGEADYLEKLNEAAPGDNRNSYDINFYKNIFAGILESIELNPDQEENGTPELEIEDENPGSTGHEYEEEEIVINIPSKEEEPEEDIQPEPEKKEEEEEQKAEEPKEQKEPNPGNPAAEDMFDLSDAIPFEKKEESRFRIYKPEEFAGEENRDEKEDEPFDFDFGDESGEDEKDAGKNLLDDFDLDEIEMVMGDEHDYPEIEMTEKEDFPPLSDFDEKDNKSGSGDFFEENDGNEPGMFEEEEKESGIEYRPEYDEPEPERPEKKERPPLRKIEAVELFKNKKMSKIVETLFDYDMEELDETLEHISRCQGIDEAFSYLDKVFERNAINPRSKEAEAFKTIIEEYF